MDMDNSFRPHERKPAHVIYLPKQAQDILVGLQMSLVEVNIWFLVVTISGSHYLCRAELSDRQNGENNK